MAQYDQVTFQDLGIRKKNNVREKINTLAKKGYTPFEIYKKVRSVSYRSVANYIGNQTRKEY